MHRLTKEMWDEVFKKVSQDIDAWLEEQKTWPAGAVEILNFLADKQAEMHGYGLDDDIPMFSLMMPLEFYEDTKQEYLKEIEKNTEIPIDSLRRAFAFLCEKNEVYVVPEGCHHILADYRYGGL